MNKSNTLCSHIDQTDPHLSYNTNLRKALINPEEKQDMLRTFDARNSKGSVREKNRLNSAKYFRMKPRGASYYKNYDKISN